MRIVNRDINKVASLNKLVNKKPQAVKVKSSNLKEVLYDDKKNSLTITFMNGRKYKYSNVPKRIYTNLLSATSKGEYFHAKIRNVFSYKEL